MLRQGLGARLKRWVAGGTAAVLLAMGTVRAEDPSAVQELRQRLEALERQNQQLLHLLQTTQPPAPSGTPAGVGKESVQKIVADYLKDQDAQRKQDEDQKKKEAEAKGSVVGADLGMAVRWDHGLWAETKDKAFRVHVGGRTQFDTFFYQVDDNVMFGNNGVGRVDDGVAFRRARLAVEGTLWEVIDFNMEYDFLNTDTLAQNVNLTQTRRPDGTLTNVTASRVGRVLDTPVPTDLWVSIKKLPLIENFRIGNQKPPISFEHLTSSRFLNFMERSYTFDAYVGGPDNGFSPGFQTFRNFLDDRVHFATALTRFNQTVFGFNTGDGEWATTTRLGAFPIWENDGRVALWVGCGYQHADPDFLVTGNRQFARATDGQVRLRARTLLRNGPAELHTPLLDLFPVGSARDLVVPEVALVCGPWTVQSEYFGHWLHDARDTATGPNRGTMYTQGAYVEVLYFLTGEHRVFNRVTPGFTRVVPHEKFWLVKGDCGPLLGRGAWQVGVRYSWIDLDDNNVGGGNNIRGSAQALTLGLNWFLNPNMKLQWNYTYEHRYQINQAAGVGLFPNLPSNGDLHGLGMRMAVDF